MSSSISEQTLHILRIRGRVTLQQLAESLGSEPGELSGVVAELADHGLVRDSGNPRIPWSSTAAGRQVAETGMTGIDAAAKARCAEH